MWHAVEAGWPRFRNWCIRVWNALPWPWLHHFHRTLIAPLWRVLSPFVLPAATATIAGVAAAGAVTAGVGSGKGAVVLALRVLCVAAASTSTAILVVHAWGRSTRAQVRLP